MQLPKYKKGDLVLFENSIRQVSGHVWGSTSTITGTYYRGWIYSLEPLKPLDWLRNVTEPQLEPMFTL